MNINVTVVCLVIGETAWVYVFMHIFICCVSMLHDFALSPVSMIDLCGFKGTHLSFYKFYSIYVIYLHIRIYLYPDDHVRLLTTKN